MAQFSSHKNRATMLPIATAMGMMIMVQRARYFRAEKCSRSVLFSIAYKQIKKTYLAGVISFAAVQIGGTPSPVFIYKYVVKKNQLQWWATLSASEFSESCPIFNSVNSGVIQRIKVLGANRKIV